MTKGTSEGCHEPLLPRGLEGVDEASTEVFRAFIGALHLHRRFMVQALGEHGAHPGQAVCLRLLSTNDDITQRDLAEAMHVARPTLSKMLRAMEHYGWVRRSVDKADQRLLRVRLTSAGRAAEVEMRGALAVYVREAIATLPREDRLELRRLLDKLSANISRAVAARAPAPEAVDGDGDGRPTAGEVVA